MLSGKVYILVIAVYLVVLVPDVVKLIKLARKPSLDNQLERYIFRIHLIVLICGLSLTTVLIAFEVNVFNYAKPIAYADRATISFDDFKGLKKPNQNLQGSNAFAFITSDIMISTSAREVRVTSYFHPSRSYVYNEHLEDKSLLTHELYHFDITELWARHLRAELSELGEYPSDGQLEALYQEMLAREDSMQQAYDYDTNHGYLLGKQLEWQSAVDSMLTHLGTYGETSVHF